jgi:Flp pilus assembly protein TadD
LLLFAGCQTTGGYDVRSEARAAKIDAALQRAAQEGASKGKSRASLAVLEQEYKKNSGDLETAMAYAGALREAGYFNRALIILAPLAGKDNAPSAIQSEYSMVVLGMGKYEEAENYARKAIRKNSENYKAYHALGIALDALGHHEQAEVAYRKGLDNWQGDPTPIMNNLALNLATQGLLDEAAQILRRAADAAPQRTEIARNLRIVSALQKTQDYNRPKVSPKIDPDKLVRPAHKPEKDS